MLDLFITKKRFTWFILAFLILAGIYVMLTIPRESLPEIKIPIIGVTTVYPGASSVDVEQLVTDPMEKQLLRGLDDVKNITSTSSEGVSSIIIEFEDSIEIDQAVRNVRDEVSKVGNDIPSETLDPLVQEFSFDDQPVFVVSLSSREAFTQLSDTANKVEDIFSDINGVSRVEVSGIPERQINIIVNKNTLATFDINISDIGRAIAQSDISFPIGSIVQDGVEYNISVDNTISSIEDIENIIVAHQNSGSPLYIKDIARIEDGLAAYTSLSRLSTDGKSAQQSITFSIFKQVGFDITKVTADSNKAVNELKEQFPDMSFITLIDMGEDVSKDIGSLTQSALVTIILVMVVLALGLGIREAFIAGIAVPLSFLLSFIGLSVTGNTINFISLFALILAIGMLVDSSIVIIEGITLARERGLSHDAAIRSTLKEFAAPVIAGTMTTLVVFIPLANISGITGQFIRSIPITIIFVLISALIVSLIFVPLLSTLDWKKFSLHKRFKFIHTLDQKREVYVKKLNIWYQQNLRNLLDHPKLGRQALWGLGVLFTVSLSLIFTGLIKSEFFPQDEFKQITIHMDIPEGSLIENSDLAIEPVEKFLLTTETVESFVTQIRSHDADITVILRDADDGDSTLQEIRNFLKDDTSGATFLATPPASGPSSGAPFTVNVTGDDYQKVLLVSERMKNLLKTIPGTTDATTSVSETALGFSLNLDVQKVREVGLDVATLSGIVRGAVFGSEVATISRDGEDVDVRVIAALNENYTTAETTNHISFDELRALPIQTPSGEIPLGILMKEELRGSNPSIQHKDGDRVVNVSSYLQEGIILSQVTTVFDQQVSGIEGINDVDWNYAGDAEQSAEAGKELGIALLLGIFLVIGVLIFQFNSMRNTVFIFSVVPLGLIGVLWGLFLFNQTLSFPAMLGFVALVGIVVNNSIILIDVITNLQQERKLTHREVIIEGSVSRLRPILLTTSTTIMGMVPLLFTSPVWLPLALAIICGLTFAVVLTLFIVPLLFYRWGRKVEIESEHSK